MDIRAISQYPKFGYEYPREMINIAISHFGLHPLISQALSRLT